MIAGRFERERARERDQVCCVLPLARCLCLRLSPTCVRRCSLQRKGGGSSWWGAGIRASSGWRACATSRTTSRLSQTAEGTSGGRASGSERDGARGCGGIREGAQGSGSGPQSVGVRGYSLSTCWWSTCWCKIGGAWGPNLASGRRERVGGGRRERAADRHRSEHGRQVDLHPRGRCEHAPCAGATRGGAESDGVRRRDEGCRGGVGHDDVRRLGKLCGAVVPERVVVAQRAGAGLPMERKEGWSAV
eukprot:1735460-Pleurochrysis_carterae.AAC.4